MNKTTENRLGGELRSQQAARRLLEELRRGRYADAAQRAEMPPCRVPGSMLGGFFMP